MVGQIVRRHLHGACRVGMAKRIRHKRNSRDDSLPLWRQSVWAEITVRSWLYRIVIANKPEGQYGNHYVLVVLGCRSGASLDRAQNKKPNGKPLGFLVAGGLGRNRTTDTRIFNPLLY